MIEKSVIITTDPPDFKWRMDDLVSSPLMKSFMAGALSGACSTVLFQPLDLIKTRLQKSANLGSRLGMFTEIANVVRQEKMYGLWTGLKPSLLRCVPGIGLYFTSLHWLKSSFGSEFPHPLESVFMGASARTIAGVTVLPFTVLKTRYESGEFHYKSLSDGIRSTYAKEGFRALYSGLTPTLLRDVPFSGIYFMFYTQMKLHSTENGTISSPYVNFTNGIMSGLLASFVTQPADVIKTNMQLNPTKFGRLKNVIILVYMERGIVGFWRGMVPRMLRRTLMSAMAWTVYEEVEYTWYKVRMSYCHQLQRCQKVPKTITLTFLRRYFWKSFLALQDSSKTDTPWDQTEFAFSSSASLNPCYTLYILAFIVFLL